MRERRKTGGLSPLTTLVVGEGWRHVREHPLRNVLPSSSPLPREQMGIPDSGKQALITKVVDSITAGTGHWHPIYDWDQVFTTSLRIPRQKGVEEAVVHDFLDTLRGRVNELRDSATVNFAPFSQVVLAIHREGPPGLFFSGIGLYIPFLVPTIGGVDMSGDIEKLFTQRVISLSHLGTATRHQVETFLKENFAFLNKHFNLGLNWVDLKTDHEHELDFNRERVALTVVHTSDIQPTAGTVRN